MRLRYDQVIREQYLNLRLTYSLFLNDDGIYILHAGDAALPRDAAPDSRLLDQLAGEEHSAFIPYADVYSLVGRARPDDCAMFLKTRQGDFSFRFVAASIEDVHALLQTITERKP